ncbi:MAG TPA: DNA topoisomerase, partial [Ferruginibacter sp.]|nr:DNA topoisomerase [Ferruginibacter sp.]
SSFKVEATLAASYLNDKLINFKAEGERFNQKDNAEKFLRSCIGAAYKVTGIQVRPSKRSPAAPFTTSTLQQEASRKLGYGVSKTMMLAQKLYESGKITYMRTDSVNLSDTARQSIKKEIRRQLFTGAVLQNQIGGCTRSSRSHSAYLYRKPAGWRPGT